MATQTRRTYDTEFKAAALARLSQESAAAIAADLGVHMSVIYHWKKQAGMASPASGRRRKSKRPNERQQAALLDAAKGHAISAVAKHHGVSRNTLSKWIARFGLPTAPANANGAALVPLANGSSPTLVSNGARALSPVAAVLEAKALLHGILQQLDSVASAIAAFQQVFGGPPQPASSSHGAA
mgnify:FL=1